MLNADNKKFHLFWILLMSLSTWLVKWLISRKLSISSGSKASRERTLEERQSHEYCVSFRLLLACLPAISSKGVYALTALWVLSTLARLGTVSEMAGRYGQQFFLPRRLQCLFICNCRNKDSTSSSVNRRPWLLKPPVRQTRAKLTLRQLPIEWRRYPSGNTVVEYGFMKTVHPSTPPSPTPESFNGAGETSSHFRCWKGFYEKKGVDVVVSMVPLLLHVNSQWE